MNEFAVLAVNEPYNFPLPGSDGAVSDFLRKSGSRLLIAISDISDHEAKIMRAGILRCGLLAKEGAILLIWQFCDKKGRPIFTLDSPFDSRIIPNLTLHNIDNSEQRMLIDIHIVDSATKIIRGLRAVTFSPAFTLDFLSAVQIQMASLGGDDQLNVWMKEQPFNIAKRIKMTEVGL